MRLLEPVSEWRITLKQVMKHKWFTGTEHIPRSIPLGDMMYQKRELCEAVLAYMKLTLRIRTKDTINAVVSNRYTVEKIINSFFILLHFIVYCIYIILHFFRSVFTSFY